MRLILHTAVYWLLWRIQQAIPKATALTTAEFATLRLWLIKVAARVIESASRIRVAFASACPMTPCSKTLLLAFGLPPHSQRGRAAQSPKLYLSTSKSRLIPPR
jgi:hypothetical protein